MPMGDSLKFWIPSLMMAFRVIECLLCLPSMLSLRAFWTASSEATILCSSHLSPLLLRMIFISRSLPRREAKCGISMTIRLNKNKMFKNSSSTQFYYFFSLQFSASLYSFLERENMLYVFEKDWKKKFCIGCLGKTPSNQYFICSIKKKRYCIKCLRNAFQLKFMFNFQCTFQLCIDNPTNQDFYS